MVGLKVHTVVFWVRLFGMWFTLVSHFLQLDFERSCLVLCLVSFGYSLKVRTFFMQRGALLVLWMVCFGSSFSYTA